MAEPLGLAQLAPQRGACRYKESPRSELGRRPLARSKRDQRRGVIQKDDKARIRRGVIPAAPLVPVDMPDICDSPRQGSKPQGLDRAQVPGLRLHTRDKNLWHIGF